MFVPDYAPNECCRKEENLRQGPGPRGWDGRTEGLDIVHCNVCKSRHFEAEAETGQIGVEGVAL